ncbi:MAG: HhH-GPD family protein [Bacteroidetes bacterium]|nr:HhH-GPD family protein [Bacteroidota bacterium]
MMSPTQLTAKRKHSHSSSAVATPEVLQQIVVSWFLSNSRSFPWRDTQNPFHVFVAEMLLRQTQAERVIGPYQELINKYPDENTLASADVEALRAWFRPLGLSKRADNLVQAAETIVKDFQGIVPNNLNALLSLPGVGIYSASAILCLSFGGRVPMIDESSGRLLRRVFVLPSRGPAYSDKKLLQLASDILPEKSSREFNLGLLDIAAKFCHSRMPDCRSCPLVSMCAFGASRA